MPEKTPPTAIATRPEEAALAKPGDFSFALDVQRVVAMRRAVEEVIEKVLKEGEHYGVLPGTGDRKDAKGKPLPPKKMLFQPGAEVLAQVFRFRPEFEEMTVVEEPLFLFYKIRCRLYSAATGELVGEAIGSCNTREDRYVKQTSERLCPSCGKAAIIKGQEKYGGGWVCWDKKGGCGAKYGDDDKKLIDQSGALSTEKVWGLHHTVLSMAQKRPFVAAVRHATGTSDVFTDEDLTPDEDGGDGKPGRRPAPQPQGKGARADATAIRDLNKALVDASIRGPVDPQASKNEQDDADRAARFRWMNLSLKEWGEPEVANMMELTPEQAKALTEAAVARKLPQGW